jgi:hypothetical protein
MLSTKLARWSCPRRSGRRRKAGCGAERPRRHWRGGRKSCCSALRAARSGKSPVSRTWLQIAVRAGALEGLAEELRPGHLRLIRDERVEAVTVMTLEEMPPDGDTHWSVRGRWPAGWAEPECDSAGSGGRLGNPHLVETWKLRRRPQEPGDPQMAPAPSHVSTCSSRLPARVGSTWWSAGSPS